MARDDNHTAFIRKVGEEMREFVQGLLAEKDRLGRTMAGLEYEIQSLTRRAAVLEKERDALQIEHAALVQRLTSVEVSHSDLGERFVELSSQANDITNLYVASYQLHGSVELERVMEAVKEIVINLIGSEWFVVLDHDPATGLCQPIGSFGVDETPYQGLRPGDDPLGRCLQSGEVYLRSPDAEAEPVAGRTVVSCAPLRLEGVPVGAVVIERLLPQKRELGPSDVELLGLLGTQAATSIYCARLHAKHGAAKAG